MASDNLKMAPSPWQTFNGQGVLRIPTMNARSHPQVEKYKVPSIKIGTWNAQSLFAAGKTNNIIKEMKRLRINILGVSEVRWPDSGKTVIDGHTMYYSGNGDPCHYNGVAVVVDGRTNKSVMNFVPLSDRAMLLQLKSSTRTINILQAYAPTADKSESEVTKFYADIKQLLEITKHQDVTIIMGDFNSKVGKGRVEDIVGDYGLGDRNARGDTLIEFCQEENFVITNTWFRLPNRRLYTWKSPQDRTNNIVRNQIDFIMINKRYRNGIQSVKTYPGADIGSDHNPVVARVHIKLKKITTTENQQIDTRILKDPSQYEEIKTVVNLEIKEQTSHHIVDTVDSFWNCFKQPIIDIQNNKLKTQRRTRDKNWMTQDILDLMEIRRNYKGTDGEKYKETNRKIRLEVRKAKEKWMQNKCRELEDLQKKHDHFNMYRKIKEVTGIKKKHSRVQLVNNDNKLITSENEMEEEWTEYIEDFFNDDRDNIEDLQIDEPALEILLSEVNKAINGCKTGKSPGPDGLLSEMLQLLDEENTAAFTRFINLIYETNSIPQEWLESIFIPIPKKPGANKCNQYRLISLMSHALKVLLRIIHKRIYLKCEQDMSNEQFGFRLGYGTREALFSLSVLLQNCRDQRKDVYICFIDYEKAFDRVKHTKLMQILRNLGLDPRDISIIKNLYWNQTARTRVNDKITRPVPVNRGVRQGCILSPLLFNVYSDQVFKEALNNATDGIKINGRLLNNIRYADDTAIIADTPEGLQRLMDSISNTGEAMGLKINAAKTKVMVVSRAPNVQCNIRINNQSIQHVKKFKYLGSWITNDLDPEMEIRTRIEMARSTFLKMRPLLTDSTLSLDTRYSFVKTYIHSILLYGVESWTMGVRAMNRLEAFEMWLFRRMLKIPWTDHTTNAEVLRRMGRERKLLTTVKKRKTAYLGHIYRGNKYNFLNLIIEGKIEGRRGPGRRKCSWLKNIRDWTNLSSHDLIRAAQDREEFAIIVANLQ